MIYDLKPLIPPKKRFSSCVFVAPGTPRIRTAQIPVESITRPGSLKLAISVVDLGSKLEDYVAKLNADIEKHLESLYQVGKGGGKMICIVDIIGFF